MPIILILLFIFFPIWSWSYPEFIGYKYSSCLTCHFNGNGNGPLNDYGRALWSSEIAGRFLAGGKTDEQLGESSGFFGSAQLPWWIRPGLKYRRIGFETNPGSKDKVSRYITMQADASLAIFFDPDQKFAFIGSAGYIPKKEVANEDTTDWISREHYFRWQMQEDFWLYVGLMDKPYGIRIVDHTAFSRQMTNLSQADQSHGVLAHWVKTNWEWSVEAFVGNLRKNMEFQQQGVSTMFEYELIPNWRVGASALASASKQKGNQRLGVHSRYGLGYGSAMMFELGLINDTPKGDEATQGYYFYGDFTQRLIRGYHLFAVTQAYKQNVKTANSDSVRTGFGFLMFPMARAEFRLEAQQDWTWPSNANVQKDVWTVLGQVHISL